MVFSSVVFLFVFLPLVLLFYYIMPKKARNAVLLIVSLIFYAWGEPVYVLLMIGSTVAAYIFGLLIGRFKEEGQLKRAKASLVGALVFHLGCLTLFKYANFFIDNLNNWFNIDISTLDWALPIGISFYTFQILSYLIDVYCGRVKVQKSWINLASYVALFPQLIAGPIVRYETVENELSKRQESVDLFAQGVRRFVAGLGKKVLIANTVGELYTMVHNLDVSKQSVLMLWMASIAYTLQIYYDFSGYSDMAIGLGKMFGFHFLENFNYPYISVSITEFWRRWHISLSSWFRDYLYIPLGGNRRGKLIQYRNIFIVWFLTGFWHGAAWNFIVWGLYFCVLLIIEKLGFGNLLKRIPLFFQHIYTMFLVIISWTIFAANSMSECFVTLKGMFGMEGLPICNDLTVYYMTSYGILFVAACIGATPLLKRFYVEHITTRPINLPMRYQVRENHLEFVGATREEIAGRNRNIIRETGELIAIFAVLLLSIAYLVSASFNPFLYFRF